MSVNLSTKERFFVLMALRAIKMIRRPEVRCIVAAKSLATAFDWSETNTTISSRDWNKAYLELKDLSSGNKKAAEIYDCDYDLDNLRVR